MHRQHWDTAGALMLGWTGVPDSARTCSDFLLPPPWSQALALLCGAIPCLRPSRGYHLQPLILNPFMVDTGLERQKEPAAKCGSEAPPAGASLHGFCARLCSLLPALLLWFSRGVLVLSRHGCPGDFLGRSICLGLLIQFPPSHAGLLGLPLGQLTTR